MKLVCSVVVETYLAVLFSLFFVSSALTQEKSVRPGINDSFQDPDVTSFLQKFEVESRELFVRRKEIVAACKLEAGQTVADIGAGTGLFTRLFSESVGPDGHVIAVDIAENFLHYIQETCRAADLKNVDIMKCTVDSTGLSENSIDVAFICDTYHHFEFPTKTMASVYSALKPGGRLILIDFRREEGKSTDWVLNHVRAGQDVFEQEVEASGLEKVSENLDMLKENYLVEFRKPAR